MDNHCFIRFINFLILIWLCCSLVELSLASNATYPVYCTTTERRALVSFKQGLLDPSARLSSWVGKNCCQWPGITCDFIFGKVTKIDLQNTLGFTIYHSLIYDSRWIDFEVAIQEYKRTCLGGDISPSLLKLKHLNYLDLSGNDFEGAPIPYFFGKLKNLRYLNLSFAHFEGVIPFHLGNLSSLNYLDLRAYNSLIDGESMRDPLHGVNLQWLSGLSSLKYLDLGWLNLSSVQANWMHAITRLSSLLELHLSRCSISSFDSSSSFLNFTSLRVLDLSFNSINSSLLWLSNLTSLTTIDIRYNTFQVTIPQNFVKLKNLQYLDISWPTQGEVENHMPSFLGNLCQLRYLNLGGNHFGGKLDEFLAGSSNCSGNKLETLNLSANRLVGEIPKSLGIFENLQYLYLSKNELWGSLPNSIGNLSSLQELYVSRNLLNGTIPPSFGQLSELIEFESYDNSWKSIITEAQLVNLTKLEAFVISTPKENDQHLVFIVPHDWIPPFKLMFLILKNCFIGPRFPSWLQFQTQLTKVTLSNVGISDFVPNGWIPKMSSHIWLLDLSNNLLKGNLSHLLASQDANSIDHPSHNLSKDSIPPKYPNLNYLILQNNLLSGHIPSNMGDLMPNLKELELSENHFNGRIPSISTIKMSYLRILSLSNNRLSGELLDYGDTLEVLAILDLANNNLYGKIPMTIGMLTSLNILVLSNNHFHGEIPKSLQNCSLLKIIDFGGNRLHGSLPSWIGRSVVSSLSLINLRSNLLSGTIPRQWCNLPSLRILDLSNNNLSREVPSCLYNWTTFSDEYYYPMNLEHISGTISSIYISYFVEKLVLIMKGSELEYNTTLKYVLTIDLSRNKLSGKIPKGITKFVHLVCLNLSNNDFVGTIPENIGAMQSLETLDLSRNQLSGKIPTSLASLNFLEKLNLSFNNLTGSIPRGKQLQTLDDPSIYEGNPSLCGFPLQTKCNENEDPKNSSISTSEEDVKKNDSEMFGFYMGMAIGFPIGLNIFFFTIFTSKSRRMWYCRFIHHVSYIILDKIDFFLIHMRRSTRWRRS